MITGLNHSQYKLTSNAEGRKVNRACVLHFHQTSDQSLFSFYLPISILLPLSYADYIRLLLPFLLSLITPIVDPPLYYLVAGRLSPYQHGGFYLV